jgi:RNA polymerase sigma factor (sigma-70 family)
MTTSELQRLGGAKFQETHWSVILQFKRGAEDAEAAIEYFANAYRRPIYSFIRNRGFSPEDAEDFTQGFMLEIIERDALRKANPEKGRFRSYLLAALKNFLANEWDKRSTQKRGGHYQFISFDDPDAEAFHSEWAASSSHPEKLFDRIWALSLVEQARTRLREEYQEEGRLAFCEALFPMMLCEESDASYADLSIKLGQAEGSLRNAVSKLRARYGKLIRRLIRNTVPEDSDIEKELDYLMSCLS